MTDSTLATLEIDDQQTSGGLVGTFSPRTEAPKTRKALVLFRIIRRILAVAVCICALVIAVAVTTGRWELLPVLSGSMSPHMKTGSLAVTESVPISQLHLGEVAVFHPPFSPKVIYIHRVVFLAHSHGRLLVRTKGDANSIVDPWTVTIDGSSINVVRFSIPLVGYLILWVHSTTGRALILICAGLLSLVLVLSSFKQLGKKAIQPDQPDQPDQPEIIIDLRDHVLHDQLPQPH